MRTCCRPDCNKLCAVSPTREHSYCREHLNEYLRAKYARGQAELEALQAENRKRRLRPAFWRVLLTPWRRRYPLVSAEEAQRMYRLDGEHAG